MGADRFRHRSRPDLSLNCRLIPANRELRQRAKLGQYFDRLSRFGIGLDQVKPQRTTIETARKQDKHGVAVTISAYRHLDLDAETKRLAKEPSASPPVPLGPRIVAGEGGIRTITPSFEFFRPIRYAKPNSSPTLPKFEEALCGDGSKRKRRDCYSHLPSSIE